MRSILPLSVRLLASSVLITALVAGCGDGEDDIPKGLAGTWVGTGQAADEVTMVLEPDGTFTWSSGDLAGSWEGDDTQLTFAYPDSASFCPGGSLTWDYEIDGGSLTADLVDGTCAGFSAPPGSPDWTFTRQNEDS